MRWSCSRTIAGGLGTIARLRRRGLGTIARVRRRSLTAVARVRRRGLTAVARVRRRGLGTVARLRGAITWLSTMRGCAIACVLWRRGAVALGCLVVHGRGHTRHAGDHCRGMTKPDMGLVWLLWRCAVGRSIALRRVWIALCRRSVALGRRLRVSGLCCVRVGRLLDVSKGEAVRRKEREVGCTVRGKRHDKERTRGGEGNVRGAERQSVG